MTHVARATPCLKVASIHHFLCKVVSTRRFPLLMLNGRHVGETVVKESALRGLTVPDYIAAVDAEYDLRLSNRLPAEILRD